MVDGGKELASPRPPPASRRRLDVDGGVDGEQQQQPFSTASSATTTTILDLPNDLIVSIFELIQQDTSATSPRRRWVRETFPLVCREWNSLYCSRNASPLTETLELDFKGERRSRARPRQRGVYCSIRPRRLGAWVERHAVDIRRLSLKFGFLLDHHHTFSRERDLAELVSRLAPVLTEVSMEHCDDELPVVIRSLAAEGAPSFADGLPLRSFEVETIGRIPEGHFASLGKLESLEALVVRCPDPCTPNYGLGSVPGQVCSLTRLTRVELNNNVAIVELPAEISSLRDLRVLNLCCCGLRFLSEGVGKLTSLTRLVLATNEGLGLTAREQRQQDGLGDDDDDDDNDDGDSDVGDGDEQKFPAALGALSSLAYLDLRFCNLRYLPSFVTSLTSLEALHLRGNRFYKRGAPHHGFPPSFPEVMPRLTHLDLQGCGLSSIPEAVVSSSMSALKELNLRSNDLTELPKNLRKKLRGLEAIDLSHNDFPEERAARAPVAAALAGGATPLRVIGFAVDGQSTAVDRRPLPGTLSAPPPLPAPMSRSEEDERISRFYNSVLLSESERAMTGSQMWIQEGERQGAQQEEEGGEAAEEAEAIEAAAAMTTEATRTTTTTTTTTTETTAASSRMTMMMPTAVTTTTTVSTTTVTTRTSNYSTSWAGDRRRRDLLVSIFSLALEHEPRRTIASLPLVCRAWRALTRNPTIARPLRQVLAVDPRYDSAAAVLAWARSPRGAAVTKLVVAKGAGCAACDFVDFTPESLASLVAVLGPRLTEISVAKGFGSLVGPSFWQSMREAVVAGSAGRLRVLRVSVERDLSARDLDFVRDLWSSLTEVSLAVPTALRHVPPMFSKLASSPPRLLASEARSSGTISPSFPDALLSLVELRSLTVDGSLVGVIPRGISSLQNLERLSARDCSLRALPAELGALTNLTSLDLSGNELLGETAFPAALAGAELVPAALLTLQAKMALSEARAFPPALCGLGASLRVLKLDGCGLRVAPFFVCALRKLESLSLRGNDFRCNAAWCFGRPVFFPMSMPALLRLDLDDCKLSCVPPAVSSSMAGLTELSLAGNEIEYIGEEFGENLPRLEKISLQRNNFSSVPRALARARALVEIDLSYNARLQVQQPLDFLLEGLPKLMLLDLERDAEVAEDTNCYDGDDDEEKMERKEGEGEGEEDDDEDDDDEEDGYGPWSETTWKNLSDLHEKMQKRNEDSDVNF